MAAKIRADSLSIEFECAVCFDQLKQPKYIGPCNHTFCKDCIHKLWVSLDRRRIIPCPQCRRDCPISLSGADALNDNFTLSNIMETYQTQQKSNANPAEVKCIMPSCLNRASSLCKECDFKLCASCIEQHNPKKRDHNVFGMCSSHGNGLFFFCHPCKKAVCSACRISDHNQGNHAVTPIGLVLDALVSNIQESFAELNNCVEDEERNMSALHDVIQQKTYCAEAEATAATERVIVCKKKDIRDCKVESQNIQAQLDSLVKKKAKVDDVTRQLIKDVDKLEKEKTNTIADIRKRVAKSSEDIKEYLRPIDARREEMKARLQLLRGHADRFYKISIDDESIASLARRNEELKDLVRASRESGNTMVIEKARKSVGELGSDVHDIGKICAVLRDSQQSTRDKWGFPQVKKAQGQGTGGYQNISRETKSRVSRVFTQLKKVNEIPFPIDCPCRFVDKMLHLPDGRLASLGRSTQPASGPAEMIYLHDAVSDALSGTIGPGVLPANDMAVLSTSELVVARAEKPPVRVFNTNTGAYRDVNISHNEKAVGDVCSVETDPLGNMFVLTSYPRHVLVVNRVGNVIQHAKLDHAALKMAFCEFSGILYIAARDTIRRFHWKNSVLSELKAYQHGIEGLQCYDVCVGSGGEVLGVGDMNGDAMIYQVREGAMAHCSVWSEISYQDEAAIRHKSVPLICVRGDNLWLGYEYKLEKFKLVHDENHDSSDGCIIM